MILVTEILLLFNLTLFPASPSLLFICECRYGRPRIRYHAHFKPVEDDWDPSTIGKRNINKKRGKKTRFGSMKRTRDRLLETVLGNQQPFLNIDTVDYNVLI